MPDDNHRLNIRRYRAADNPAVWELHNLGLNQMKAHAGSGEWDDDLNNIEAVYLAGGEFLVGEHQGRAVAIGGLKPTGPGQAEIKRMRVHPDYQGRGFGQALLEALERRALELGFRRLHLDTTTGQTPAQGLYRKMGYRETGRKVIMGFDCILFEKRLDGIF